MILQSLQPSPVTGTYKPQYQLGIKTIREYCHTSYIANARSPKHTNELAGGTAIVTDRYNVRQRTVVILNDLAEDIHQAVGRRATTEYNQFSWINSHCAEIS